MKKLYYSPGACSLAPHILLEEIGAPYALEAVPVAEGKNLTQEYLAINPKGRVPALGLNDGGILTELPAICIYLARTYPAAHLLPDDPLLFARCLEWFNWLSGNVHGIAFAQLWRAHRFTSDETGVASVAAKGKENVLEAFARIEQQLVGRSWVVGERYSTIDPFLLVFYRWGNRIKLDMRTVYPHWTSHAERMLARPAVMRALEQENISIWH